MWQKRLISLKDPPTSSKKRIIWEKLIKYLLFSLFLIAEGLCIERKKTFTPIYQGIRLPFYKITKENEDDFQICFSMWKIMFCEKDLSVQNKFLEK